MSRGESTTGLGFWPCPRINGVVNAYNAASVLFCVPAGVFDLDQFAAQ